MRRPEDFCRDLESLSSLAKSIAVMSVSTVITSLAALNDSLLNKHTPRDKLQEISRRLVNGTQIFLITEKSRTV